MGPPTAFRPGEVVLIRFPFSDLSQTKLRPFVSYVLPGKLFTAHRTLIIAHLGTLKSDAFKEIAETVINILGRGI